GGVVAEVECQLAAGDVAASRRRIAEYTAYKQAHQPLAVPSAGCLFKNVGLTPDDQWLRQRFAAVIKDNRLPAWALISAAGLAGKTVGRIQISQLHANFFTNLGGGTAEQVVMLASLVKQRVRDSFGVQLQEEVQFIGF
ncbi:MAG: hypothetical protein HY421_02930, partial [Candidatus Kerfeldbacteria bacterium]|nr:hypothetical protein [Candidatus Kerfeldbacteria bacterium]